jgi:hypothetical protein
MMPREIPESLVFQGFLNFKTEEKPDRVPQGTLNFCGFPGLFGQNTNEEARKMRKTKKRVKIKKQVILRLLDMYQGCVPLAIAAKELYGDGGQLAQIKVVRAVCGYRSWADEFAHIRVKRGNIINIT